MDKWWAEGIERIPHVDPGLQGRFDTSILFISTTRKY